MRAITITAFAIIFLSANVRGQVQNKSSNFMDHAEIQHGANSTTVVANSPRPLEQAVEAVAEEYGWTIDYEDPPYSSQLDLVDDTAPEWRAQHPDAKGVTRINGGAFQSTFPENVDTGHSITAEKMILNKLVSDYNQSRNPGKFFVRDEGQGRFSIIGTSVMDDSGTLRQIQPILDTSISIPSEKRDGETTLELILSILTTQSGTTVNPNLPVGLLRRSTVITTGQNVPARTLLKQVLSATGDKLYWELRYDADVKEYALNLVPVMRAEYDAYGNRKTVFVK